MTKQERLIFFKKFATETMFFKNDSGNAVVKSVPGNACFVKVRGEQEFKATPQNTLVNETISENKQITKEQYEGF